MIELFASEWVTGLVQSCDSRGNDSRYEPDHRDQQPEPRKLKQSTKAGRQHVVLVHRRRRASNSQYDSYKSCYEN